MVRKLQAGFRCRWVEHVTAAYKHLHYINHKVSPWPSGKHGCGVGSLIIRLQLRLGLRAISIIRLRLRPSTVLVT